MNRKVEQMTEVGEVGKVGIEAEMKVEIMALEGKITKIIKVKALK